MAKAAADYLAGRDVTVLKSSPLQRAVETAEPIAAEFGLQIEIDDRLIEPWNYFEGMRFAVGDGALRKPRHWVALRNPFRPSWGEPYQDVAARVLAATADAARAAAGHEAVCVSHQMPIWIARRSVEGRRLWHDPRRRECALGSVTSLMLRRRQGHRRALRGAVRINPRPGRRAPDGAKTRPAVRSAACHQAQWGRYYCL